MSITPNALNQINELMQGAQIGSGVQFDLGDDTFANLLNSKLDSLNGDIGEIYTQLMGPLGVPAGINIEGLTDDPFRVSAIDQASLGELSLNQSEINGFDEDVLKSSGNKIDNRFFEQLGNNASITDLIQMASSKNTHKALEMQDSFSNGFGSFLKKQAANLYGTMGKTVANNIADLLSAM